MFKKYIHRFYQACVFGPYLKHLGKGTYISPYARIQNMEYISIGERSSIGRETIIFAIKQYLSSTFLPKISIGDDVYIGNRCTLSTIAEITIGDSVTIGDHCYLGGGRHGYEDISRGVMDQPLVAGSIKIGPRAWIGYGSFIATTGELEIGEHAVVAANSVITKSVPSFTLVGGNPAKPIKRYDFSESKWIRILKEDND
jgi:acetyltransferase-like isoleucine patch superfamily enzyme